MLPEREAASRPEAVLLLIHLFASVTAFALSGQVQNPWLLLIPASAGMVLPLRRVPRLASGMGYFCGTLAALVAALSLAWTLYPVVSEPAMRRIAGAMGMALVLAAGMGLKCGALARPGRNLFPLTLSLLVLASLDASPRPLTQALIALAASGSAAYLVVKDRDSGAGLRRLGSLAIFLAGMGVAALAITRFLPWAQPQVEGATARFLVPPRSMSYAGLSPTSRLGDIEEIALSQTVVMRVWTDVPQRLRARVFARFDGALWQAEPANGFVDLEPLPRDDLLEAGVRSWLGPIPGTLLRVPGVPPQATDRARTKIVQSIFNGGVLVTPMAPILVRLPSPGARLDSHGILTASPSAALEIYAVVNLPGGPVQPLSDNAASELLGVPRDLDPRLHALAAELSRGAASPEERLRRTLAYIQRECRYSLRVGRFRSRQPVAEFLFEKKRGYCEYFATAAAVLLRLQGIPARYVTGFNVRDENYSGGHYLVREADAHAWVEALMPGRGFVEIDPTPSAQYAEVHRRSGSAWSDALERVRGLAAEIGARLRDGDWRAALVWLGAGLAPPALAIAAVWAAFGLVRVALRRSRRGGGPGVEWAAGVPRELRTLVARVEAEWSRSGHARPPHRGMREHLDSIPSAALALPCREASAEIIDCFYRSRFGSMAVQDGEIAELRRRLHAGMQAPASPRLP